MWIIYIETITLPMAVIIHLYNVKVNTYNYSKYIQATNNTRLIVNVRILNNKRGSILLVLYGNGL